MKAYEPLNPIQKRIAAGENALVAFLTEATCGEACWTAQEDICRCSCGGKNHGCLKRVDGVQPTRTSKIDGDRYELKAVGTDIWKQAREINKAAGPRYQSGRYSYDWQETDKHAPARMKRATKDQIAKWPELSAAREAITQIENNPNHCFVEIDRVWPYLLWVKSGQQAVSETGGTELESRGGVE